MSGEKRLRCETLFEDTYHRPFSLSFCPYRVCPLGAHIDHQHGKVVGFALDRGVHMAYGPKQNGIIELASTNFSKRVQFHVASVPDEKEGDWGDYLRGAAKFLGEEHALTKGLCGIITGDLPSGGISSSAALTICFLRALAEVNGVLLSEEDLIRLAKKAENAYVGVFSGKLDQSCETLCRKGQLLFLDCGDDSYANIPTPSFMAPFSIGIFFSGLERNLASSAYNNRVDECKASAFALASYAGIHQGKKLEEMFLRDIPEPVYEEYGHLLPPAWKRRCNHFYGESQRVLKGVELWKRGDIAGFGALVNESGLSSIASYECGSPELIRLFEILRKTDGVYGARFSGAGFKGCCMALLDPAREASVAKEVSSLYLASFPSLSSGFKIFSCKPSDGVGVSLKH